MKTQKSIYVINEEINIRTKAKKQQQDTRSLMSPHVLVPLWRQQPRASLMSLRPQNIPVAHEERRLPIACLASKCTAGYIYIYISIRFFLGGISVSFMKPLAPLLSKSLWGLRDCWNDSPALLYAFTSLVCVNKHAQLYRCVHVQAYVSVLWDTSTV